MSEDDEADVTAIRHWLDVPQSAGACVAGLALGGIGILDTMIEGIVNRGLNKVAI